MQRIINILMVFLVSCCPFFAMGADNTSIVQRYDLDDTLEDNDQEDPEPFCIDHWDISGHYDNIFNARFRSDNAPSSQKIGYGEGEVDLSYTHCLGCYEAVLGGIGYSNTSLRWRQNPFFRETSFDNMIFTVGGFTKRMPNWLWQGGFSANVDAIHTNISDNSIYNLTIWGRYAYSDRLGLNIGFLGFTGIKKTWAVPILGFDYQPNCRWKFNLVYPVNMSAMYYITDEWALSVNGRIFNSRHRVSRNEVLSKGIFEYRNAGVELALNYSYTPFVTANVHFGSTVGGDLKVTDSSNHNPVNLKFRSSAYLGGGLDFKF